jgi:hypothetical protein
MAQAGEIVQRRLVPAVIAAGQIHHRPIASPHQPGGPEGLQQQIEIAGQIARLPIGRRLGDQPRDLAIDVVVARDLPHLPGPIIELATGDVGLGAMVDDDAQLGIERQEAPQRLQMPGLHQCIEGQAQMLHMRHRRSDGGAQHPFGIGDVLDHRPEALELRMLGQPVDLRGAGGRFEIDPADDPFDEIRRRRDGQHAFRLGHRRRRLHQHRAADAVALQERRQLRGSEIPVEQGHVQGQPVIIAAIQAPEMLVRVDVLLGVGHRRGPVIGEGLSSPGSCHPREGQAASPGTGTPGWSSLRSRSSAQKAAGIFAPSISQWLADSAGVRAPGITLATTGLAKGNCRAAAGSETSWARQTSSSFSTRVRISGGTAA